MNTEIFRNITAQKVGYALSQEASGTALLLQQPSSVSGIAEIAARNIRTYEAETLRDDVVSYFPYYVNKIDGKTRLFRLPSSKKEDLALSLIDPLERGGKVSEGFEKLEEHLGSISDDSTDNKGGFFVWVSLRGKAGEEGIYSSIEYKYHQIYIGEMKKGIVDAYALKSDIDEGILAEWINNLSPSQINITDTSHEEFLLNPFTRATQAFETNVIEKALFSLKFILEKNRTRRFYKDTDIDALPFILRRQRLKQEQEVKAIQNSIENDLLHSDRTVDDVRRIIGGQLMVLYQRYQDSSGKIKLSGCSGGSISINELFDNILSRLNSKNIFSSEYRLKDSQLSELNKNCNICGQDSSDNHYHCEEKDCLKKYADETNIPPEKRTPMCGDCGFEFACGKKPQEFPQKKIDTHNSYRQKEEKKAA